MGRNASPAMFTTPPPSGLRQQISTYFEASSTNPSNPIHTNSGATLPTRW
jgi:hypothetical protein